MKLRIMIAALFIIAASVIFIPFRGSEAQPKMEKRPFGSTQDGQTVDLYVLSNKTAFEVAVTNYGGTLVSLKAPDRNGKIADVILGYDSIAGYESGKSYFGGTIGRYANRIAHGKFILDGDPYTLAKNDGENHLHGGVIGFNKRIWNAREVISKEGQAVEMTYLSKHGEEGYPGNLSVRIVFTVLADRNALKIEYSATTDRDTVVNLTNHAYFNLSGQGNGDILGHKLAIHARKFIPVDATLIPTGQADDVHGTPFDFRNPVTIGSRIGEDNEQLKFGGGYDHNWILDVASSHLPSAAAEAYDPQSGRVLEISTTEPGIQFYSGNFLDGTTQGTDGKVYRYRSAFCLETQHFPDSPNHPNFPSTALKPGQNYRSTTIYQFSSRQ